jgi:hypothetical protein
MNGSRLLLVGCVVILVVIVLEAALRPAPPTGPARRAPGRRQVLDLPPPAPRPPPAPFIGHEAGAPSAALPPFVSGGKPEPDVAVPSTEPAVAPAAPKPPAAKAKKAPKPPPTPEQILAREALAGVGADPAAEAVWFAAINDPTRSAHERSDLIEDLNEDGFPDPKHVTSDDLPLIVSRLVLIEQLAPGAMDQTNADAFAEAYKDLLNMYARAAAQ